MRQIATAEQSIKIASDIEVRKKQRCVIEFLTAKQTAPIDIHRRLLKVYGDDTVNVSTVRQWVVRFNSGESEVHNKPRPGHPCSAATPHNEQHLDQLIRTDQQITTRELCARLNIGCNALEMMLGKLDYGKVCSRWVPQMLTQDHKTHRMEVCQDLLHQFEAEGDKFLDSIVTEDETWCHHYELESKTQSMEWRHPDSPRKKFKTQPSAGKVMCMVFWDRWGVILLDFLEPGESVNCERYKMTLTKLKARISLVRPEKQTTFRLQHDNARPHTSLVTTPHIAKFGWTVLPYPPYSPDLAPSDFHLFGPMKDGLCGQHFPDNDAVIAAVRKWLASAGADFYGHGIQALVHHWQKCITNGGDYVEK
ncbi:Mariner Mos1 transposase [Cryptotermes secundus]|uniref:Mariner Mos1 transposase n=1 Tax=Cryptotermes secundus TaxID=105785 RepID=A0A2J7Q518_9NEOP|nr:Mariner Mos1 transposase [Cryptotermes secundus]